jgi:hypothetical protein
MVAPSDGSIDLCAITIKRLEDAMATGSSWMKQKRAKMATPLYRSRFPNTEHDKPFYAGNATLAAAEHVREDTKALVADFIANGGKVRRVGCTGETPRFGKTSVCLGDTSPGRAVLKYSRHWGRAW